MSEVIILDLGAPIPLRETLSIEQENALNLAYQAIEDGQVLDLPDYEEGDDLREYIKSQSMSNLTTARSAIKAMLQVTTP